MSIKVTKKERASSPDNLFTEHEYSKTITIVEAKEKTMIDKLKIKVI